MNTWEESDWERLIRALRRKECTPFVGAGACAGHLPMGAEIANEWAHMLGYPFPDRDNLARVAKYGAFVKRDKTWPRTAFQELLNDAAGDLYTNPPAVHRSIAQLNLPIYITTNYDDYTRQALAQIPMNNGRGSMVVRQPELAICRWYPYLQGNIPDPLESGLYEPTPERPVVFHLHGHVSKADTFVLTEDDYLDFLVSLSQDLDVIPLRIRRCIAETCLLFLGYRLDDMSFKVLFHRLASLLRINGNRTHVSVQLAPTAPADVEDPEMWRSQVISYFEQHYNLDGIRIYWGTCEEFFRELGNRTPIPAGGAEAL